MRSSEYVDGVVDGVVGGVVDGDFLMGKVALNNIEAN